MDFNGDVFPVEHEEREQIQVNHLQKLRKFLLGEPTPQGEL